MQKKKNAVEILNKVINCCPTSFCKDANLTIGTNLQDKKKRKSVIA